jgi:hypothetical protein
MYEIVNFGTRCITVITNYKRYSEINHLIADSLYEIDKKDANIPEISLRNNILMKEQNNYVKDLIVPGINIYGEELTGERSQHSFINLTKDEIINLGSDIFNDSPSITTSVYILEDYFETIEETRELTLSKIGIK